MRRNRNASAPCRTALALAALSFVGSSAACSRPPSASKSWNPSLAVSYLDQRAAWWTTWSGSSRDHDTFCISCHTALPYALARSSARVSDAAATQSDIPSKFVANVTARVRLWDETEPYYAASDGTYKPEESRGTEAVLNALILVYRDAPSRRLSDEAQAALEIMWRQQQQQGASAGAWPWLQFGLEPWEAADSKYYGAALAALTVGLAPPEYRARDDIRTNVSLLRQYLDGEYPRQSLSNRATLLWASAKWPDLIDRARRDALVGELLNQQRGDGGWSLSSLARTRSGASLRQYFRSWVRQDWTLVDRDSDGYATAFVTFVLVETGMRADEPHVRRALAWLVSNQNEKDGLVPSHSLNKRRDPASNIGRFMSDAATAYSLLALSEAASH